MKTRKIILTLALLAGLMFIFTSCTCKPDLEEEKVVQPTTMSTPAITSSTAAVAATDTGAVIKLDNRIVEIGDRILPVYFDFDRAELRSDTRTTLDKLAQWLKINPSVNLRIEGNCDERGSNEYNLALGETRAAAAKKYLVYLGISPDRLETLSYGEEKPSCSESTESCWSRNRRDDFTIIAK